MGGSNGKKNRPVTAIVETNSGSTLDREGRDPAVLRKRTNSHYDSIIGDSSSSSLKPGQSVLEQIGEPDYTGWMRKKGEHYNTWKLRYFVLKGSHLYYLRSDRGTVSSPSLQNVLFFFFLTEISVNRKQKSRVTSTLLATRFTSTRMLIRASTVSA